MRCTVEFDESFEGSELDRRRWLPFYLPHWSSRESSAARYSVDGGHLRLRIDADQQPWCPEFDGEVRVSSLQTGAFAGPVGSGIGQHRFDSGVVVREAQENVRLYTPLHGRIEVRAKASADPDTMAALWLIGYEDEPGRSAEICVCEIFGRNVADDETVVGVGVHPFGDPLIVDDFANVAVAVDAREFHVYAADWKADRIVFSVDGAPIKTVDQSPAYAMQLMLGIYEFPAAEAGRSGSYPKEFVVDYVRCQR
jgi:glycosyl hydrolase family 16